VFEFFLQFPVVYSIYAATEVDSDYDSDEEEDDAVVLALDTNGNPLLPPFGNMTCSRAQACFRAYSNATYS